MDGALSKTKDETNLASSSLMEKEEAPGDLLGVVVSYSVNVKLMLACMGGELEVDLPFKLVHPRPGKEVTQRVQMAILLSLLFRCNFD